jgi:predicted O-linked N-acetylglucosamine transferase (SPINDLY family)
VDELRGLFEAALGRLQQGDIAGAEGNVRALLARSPKHVDGMQFLAVLYARQNRLEEARELLEECLRLRPNSPPVLANLGETLRQMGRVDEALARLRHAVLAAPGFAEAHYNLGVALRQSGDDEGAVSEYRRTVELAPNHVQARYNLANTLRDQGRTPMAAAEYEKVVAQAPHWAEARLNYGNALAELGRTEEALAEYHKAQELDPNVGDVATNIGEAYARLGRLEEAARWLRVNAGRRPDLWLRELRIAALAPPIPADNASIDRFREGLLARVRELAETPLSLSLAGLGSSCAEPPLALEYQGRDDRPIRDAYGELFAKLIPPLSPERGGGGKPHVGVVVTNGHEGVFYRCLGEVVERLDRSKLRVTVVCSLAGRNVMRHTMFRTPQEYFVLPPNIEEAARALAEARFDLLHYWEVGTDSMNYFLPFFRPAPVQSTTWGWPVTSGNPRIDYFVSARGLEPPDAAGHYRERLVELASAPTYYVRPPVPDRLRGRESFGLPANVRLYICPQNLRKIHPDFDEALAGVLQADGEGWLLLVADEQPAVTAQLVDRLGRRAGDARGRIRVLPRMEREDYLNVLALADVNLDTFHYGSGANTMYDTIATATPIVTLPGRFHRGRYALATLEALEWRETVAQSVSEFVDLAVRLGRDRDFRESARERLRREREYGVLENQGAVDAYQEFFLAAAGG